MKRAIIVVGLQFGDEGKGAVVDSLCRLHGVSLVVRYSGGCQAGHNVRLVDGTHHCFSQFGAGTLAGAATYLGPQVVIDPVAMAREAVHLRAITGQDPFALLVVHPDCLVATGYHRAMNRARELARGEHRHGSCGQGVGEARRYWLDHGQDAVTARDVVGAGTGPLVGKLGLLRRRAVDVVTASRSSRPTRGAEFADLDHLLCGPVTEAQGLGDAATFDLGDEYPPADTVVFEGAQGVLIDEHAGFHPHTTWSEVTNFHALDEVRTRGFDRVCTIGCCRAFTVRHGAGPLPTWDPLMSARMPDPGNQPNLWQGSLRVGVFDLPLLRYAARACGRVDGLAVSWLDHFRSGLACDGYDRETERVLFETGPPPTASAPDLPRQEARGLALAAAQHRVRYLERAGLLKLMATVAPVVMTATGPTHEDRAWANLPFRAVEGQP